MASSTKKDVIPFEICKLPYPMLAKVVLATDLAKIVPLAFYNISIRRLLERRDYGMIKMMVLHSEDRSTVTVEFPDGSKMENRFFCGFSLKKKNPFMIEDYEFKLSHTVNSSILYFGGRHRRPLTVFIDSLIKMFITSKIELEIVDDSSEQDEITNEFESFTLLQKFSIESTRSSKLIANLLNSSGDSKKWEVGPDLMNRIGKKKENSLRTGTTDEWFDDLKSTEFRKLIFKRTIEDHEEILNRLLKKWKSGTNHSFEYLEIKLDGNYPYDSSVWNRIFEGIEDVTDWEENGKRTKYLEKFRENSLRFGRDIRRDDGMWASIFSPSGSSANCVAFFFWKEQN